ncbi:MAG: transposase [Chloroflexota bacterium]
MLILPTDIMPIIGAFRQVFSERMWDWAQILLVGSILTTHVRTVASVLRVMGLSQDKQFQNFHRVLNRAKWSGLLTSKILLGLLIATFLASGMPLIIGADETLERRQGKHIKAKGVFRDAVRSSKKHKVYSFGLRWVSMMVLVPVPWSSRAWALPFLTVLAPSEKTNTANGKRHKTSIDWIGQMIRIVRRWQPTQTIVLVVDGGLAAVKLGLTCSSYVYPVVYVSRLRFDAALYENPEPQPKGKRGAKPKKGKRQPSLAARLKDEKTQWEKKQVTWYGGEQRWVEIATGNALWYTAGYSPLPLRWVIVRSPANEFLPCALFCTDQNASSWDILRWFILRWNVEVTFEEVRAHMGLETQRQWSALAIERTTPLLLGLFSVVTLLAQQLTDKKSFPVRQAAWYCKPEPTYADAIALVRRHLWTSMKFTNSPMPMASLAIPSTLFNGLLDAVCYA